MSNNIKLGYSSWLDIVYAWIDDLVDYSIGIEDNSNPVDLFRLFRSGYSPKEAAISAIDCYEIDRGY